MRNAILSIVVTVAVTSSSVWAQIVEPQEPQDQLAEVCLGDVNGDAVVNTDDLAALLGGYGPCRRCEEDLNGDGAVDSEDLDVLMDNWGNCPADTFSDTPTEEKQRSAAGLKSSGPEDDGGARDSDPLRGDCTMIIHGYGDIDADGDVDAADLATMLGNWGECPDVNDCPSNLVDRVGVGCHPEDIGNVSGLDLAMLLGNWTM